MPRSGAAVGARARPLGHPGPRSPVRARVPSPVGERSALAESRVRDATPPDNSRPSPRPSPARERGLVALCHPWRLPITYMCRSVAAGGKTAPRIRLRGDPKGADRPGADSRA
ncbi:hypothetical protein MOTC310_10750 [Methylobacterium oryzae]|uniref:Uncharacterized protein n=1 Tax=Methylobacterium oryzae TaxID=334852 RepID=A0ABU7TM95_9HYPH